MTLLSAFNWDIVWWGIIGIFVLVVLIILVKSISDWRKGSDDKESGEETKKQKTAKTEKPSKKKKKEKAITDKKVKAEKPSKKQKKEKKKSRKKAFVENETNDPLTLLLGFDPYSAIRIDECEITEEYRNPEHETEDMRLLREKMNTKKQTQAIIEELKERQSKVKYESGKTTRYLRDNGVVINSSKAVSDKLKKELNSLTGDKKIEKQNRKAIETIEHQLADNEAIVAGLEKTINEKTRDEKLLRDASNYLATEIAKTERDLSYVQADIDKLNGRVGVELKKIEDDSRARALMNKYQELKPLLFTVNSVFREINESDAQLNEIHTEKAKLRQKIDALVDELKMAYGAGEMEDVSNKINEVNKRMLELDTKEEKLISSKESKIAQFKIAKRKANDFLDNEKYSVEDIVVAEDKVVGEIEYEQVKAEYQNRKVVSGKRLDVAQKKYDEIASRKVKFGKKQVEEKQAYENEVATALANLRSARVEHDKACTDCDRVLPTLMPTSLIKSGSGVISRERILERSAVGNTSDIIDAENVKARLEAQQQPAPEFTYRQTTKEIKPEPKADKYEGVPTEALLQRLEMLEKVAMRSKNARASVRSQEQYGATVSGVERAKAQIVAMRKNLKYISGPEDAKEFKQRLYRLSISLSPEEMNDTVLSEMIRRTMDEATYLGDRAGKNGNRFNR